MYVQILWKPFYIFTVRIVCLSAYVFFTLYQCCGSGSGIQDPVPFWPLDPGSGIGFFWIPDLRSRIPNPYFWELSDNFLGEKFYNSLKIGPNFFLQHFKNKIIFNFGKFVAQNFFATLFYCCFWIRDPGSEIRDPGWVKIRIQDPW